MWGGRNLCLHVSPEGDQTKTISLKCEGKKTLNQAFKKILATISLSKPEGVFE